MSDLSKQCECCGKSDLHIAGVCSSGHAAVSLRHCDICVSLGVDPLWLIESLVETVGCKEDLIDGIVYYNGIADEYRFHKDDVVVPVTIGGDKELTKRADMVAALNEVTDDTV